jgi:predicted lipoprotein with Yx(FWY)xxD motif
MLTGRKMYLPLLSLFAFGLWLVAGSVAVAQQAPPAPLKTATAKELGTFLVDGAGMTLYVFDNDKDPGKSTCSEGCAKAWPPFGPKAGDPAPTGSLGVIARDDGSKQYGYKGKPLYYYAKDKKAGDTTGHGAGNRWWVVKP